MAKTFSVRQLQVNNHETLKTLFIIDMKKETKRHPILHDFISSFLMQREIQQTLQNTTERRLKLIKLELFLLSQNIKSSSSNDMLSLKLLVFMSHFHILRKNQCLGTRLSIGILMSFVSFFQCASS